MIVLLVALWVAAILFTGCKTSPVGANNSQTPPLPAGIVPQTAVSRVQPAIQPPPALSPVLLSWQGGVIPRAGFSTNLPAFYRVEVSHDLVTWAVLTNVVAPGPDYSVQTLAVGTNYFRVREAQPWEVSP